MIRLNSAQQNKLKKAGVIALFLFGSKALGVDGPLSDTDIAILLDKKVPEDQIFRKSVDYEYFISNLFPKIKDIEVTLLNNAPIGLQTTILREGKLLFCADYQKLADFREKTIILACDLLPFIQYHQQIFLNRFYANTT